MNTTVIRFFTIAFFATINLFGFASTESETSLFDQLKEVNAQWNFHKANAPTSNLVFKHDEDLIQYHLEQVASILKRESTVSWTSTQLTNRRQLLDVLERYAKGKVFPTNLYHSTRTPYFIDDFGVHCAVGYLIEQSGNEDLALEISKEFNYDYIENIESEELLIWAEKFGFTLDELKWIQPGYPPTQSLNPLGNGTNGNVEKVLADNYAGRIIFVGDFDSVDLQPCLNIGVFQNDQLACLGGGLAGVVNDVSLNGNEVYVVGDLESNGSTYPFAKYDGTSWSFYAIPGRPGAIGTNLLQWSLTDIEITIEHISLNGGTEVWNFSPLNNWVLKAKVNGVIFDIESTNIGRVYGGHFDTIIDYSIVPNPLAVANVFVKGSSWASAYGLGSGISDTVKTIKQVGSSIFFGGTCSNEPGVSNICLTRYLNGTFQSLLLKDDFSDPTSCSINDIAYIDGNELILGGDFEYQPLGGYYGNSLVSYHLIWNSITGMAVLDDPVNSLAVQSLNLYIGGDFKNQYTNQPVNHLARILSTIGLEEESLEINAYPNPFENTISIEGFEPNSRYSLMDLSGKLIVSDQLLLDGEIDLLELENGVYVLQIQTESGLFTERIVKSVGE